MTDPRTTVATAGLGLAAPVIGTGTLFGLDILSMAIGFGTGLVALMHLAPAADAIERPPLIRLFGLLAGSAFLAGVFAPAAMVGAVEYLPWLSGVSGDGVKLATAGVIGGGVHLIPHLLRLYREFRGGKS